MRTSVSLILSSVVGGAGLFAALGSGADESDESVSSPISHQRASVEAIRRLPCRYGFTRIETLVQRVLIPRLAEHLHRMKASAQYVSNKY